MKHYTEKEINEVIRISQRFIDALQTCSNPSDVIEAHIRALKHIGKKPGEENTIGRPKIAVPESFETVYHEWKDGKIYAVEAMQILGLKPNTFYRRVKEYEKHIGE